MSVHTGSLVVTGVDGFVGRHVARQAKDAGMAVHGIGYSNAPDSSVSDCLETYIATDLRQGWPSTARADSIIHLAALAAVGPSFGQPQRYIEANSAMVTHLAESLVSSGFEGTLLAVSSGAVYQPTGDSAQTEASPIGFTSPYVVSKILVENQIAYYRRRGIRAVVTRPFNHIGPGQKPGFLVPDLRQQLLDRDVTQPMPVGNLTTYRDYTDVRDVASAYLTLVRSPSHRHLVYNVCSGVSVAGIEILDHICSAMGIPVPETSADPARYRPVDAQRITGSSERLREEFGWTPRYTLQQTITDAVV
ncbi:NAD-dependent epimerase/dehydratase family protein [Demequina sp. SO4-13]|uniref:NAD-dependent epimerase/dehydratase family protein n=1 Tax=Demequina sp. SO4-13 TaxID=3401027 RepID=UPI003AF8D0A6